MESVIETVGLTKQFDTRNVVDEVSLSVPDASIYGVVGANGAGKSTLLRMLVGLVRPTRGEVRLFGESLPDEPAPIRQRIQYVASDLKLYRSFTVRDLMKYTKLLYTRFDEARAQQLMNALELPLHAPVRYLSLGMQMQLRLAMALCTRPDLLILDEPTNGLDPVVRRQFLQLIVQEAAGSGTTILIATHQLEELDRIADGIAVMYRGRVVAQGMLEDLKMSMSVFQAVLPGGLSSSIEGHKDVVRIEVRGQIYSFVVDGSGDDFERALEALHPPFAERISVDFEELFRYLMQKEGYARDGILLS